MAGDRAYQILSISEGSKGDLQIFIDRSRYHAGRMEDYRRIVGRPKVEPTSEIIENHISIHQSPNANGITVKHTVRTAAELIDYANYTETFVSNSIMAVLARRCPGLVFGRPAVEPRERDTCVNLRWELMGASIT